MDICCFCSRALNTRNSNSPAPLASDDNRCCNECNASFVVPFRQVLGTNPSLIQTMPLTASVVSKFIIRAFRAGSLGVQFGEPLSWYHVEDGVYTSPDTDTVKIVIEYVNNERVYHASKIVNGKQERADFTRIDEAKAYCDNQWRVYFKPTNAKPKFERGFKTKVDACAFVEQMNKDAANLAGIYFYTM